MSHLHRDAKRLVDALADRDWRVVFAESCTGGLVSAEMARVPGVSDWLCGSAVTYRGDSKVRWLGVRAATLEAHSAVSAEVTDEMVRGVLERTPEAMVAAAITGHLGPNAPSDIDGVVFTAVAIRRGESLEVHPASRHQLLSQDRDSRQREAAEFLLERLIERVVEG